MSIDRAQSPLPVSAMTVRRDFNTPAKSGTAKAAVAPNSKESGTRVKFSQIAQQIQADSAQDIDYQRIDKIRSAIESNEYTIDPDLIAQNLVNDIFQLS